VSRFQRLVDTSGRPGDGWLAATARLWRPARSQPAFVPPAAAASPRQSSEGAAAARVSPVRESLAPSAVRALAAAAAAATQFAPSARRPEPAWRRHRASATGRSPPDPIKSAPSAGALDRERASPTLLTEASEAAAAEEEGGRI